MDWPALWLTARLALVTSCVLLLIGVPLAWWLATTTWRGRIFVESIVELPLVLPPTVIGFFVLVGLGSKSPLGRWVELLTGHALPFSFAALVIASVFYSMPFAVQPFTAGFRGESRTARSGVEGGCDKTPHFFPHRDPARGAGVAFRRGAELRPHAW